MKTSGPGVPRTRLGRGLVAVLTVLVASACSGDAPITPPDPGPPEAPLDEEGSWRSRGGLPDRVSGAAAVVWRDRIYALGGFADERDGDVTRHFVRIDPESLDVDRLADYPEAVAEAALVVYRDTLLAVGGIRGGGEARTVSSAIRWYDEDRNSWVAWQPLPSPRAQHVAEAVGEHLFVIGGGTLNATDSVVRFHGRAATHLPPTNRQVTEPLAGAVVGDTIVVLSSSFDSRLLRLDGREGVWLPPIGLPSEGVATGGVLNGRVHSFEVGPLPEHRIWSPDEAAWLRAPPPSAPVESAGVVEYGGRLYLIGGFTADGTSINRIQVYTPNQDRGHAR